MNNKALRIDQGLDYEFRRGEFINWSHNGQVQQVVFVCKCKDRMSKIVNRYGLLMIVPDFELECIDPCAP
jgi:hypothetical protein